MTSRNTAESEGVSERDQLAVSLNKPRTPESSKTRPFIAVLLITASILLSLALAEGILRIFPGIFPVELQQVIETNPTDRGIAHPYIGHLHRPNSTFVRAGRDFSVAHATDQYGFRNGPWPDEAEIIAVGDSLTFGYGVESSQSWPTLIEKQLPETNLINLGLIGAGPQQYLRVYETFARGLHPKVLLVGFFPRNDFWDAGSFERWLGSGLAGNYNYMVWRDFGRPKRVDLSLSESSGDLMRYLLWKADIVGAQSRLYNLLRYARRYWKNQPDGSVRTSEGTQLELRNKEVMRRAKDARPGSPAFEAAVKALEQLHSKAKANGTDLLVILQPSKEEVYLPVLGEPAPDLTSALRKKLDQIGIPYLDLLEDFQNRAEHGEALFFEADGHPNSRGHALTAEVILDHLNKNAEQYSLNSAVASSRQESNT